ncbi:MAG TPA: hypothetical protein VGU45_01490 [Microvirga sp.]|jgi:hypothetical protein|nr:hypothetical protein [Microvirga sp.]
MGAAKADMMREDAVRLAKEEHAEAMFELLRELKRLLEADSDSSSFSDWEEDRDAAVEQTADLLARIEDQSR